MPNLIHRLKRLLSGSNLKADNQKHHSIKKKKNTFQTHSHYDTLCVTLCKDTFLMNAPAFVRRLRMWFWLWLTRRLKCPLDFTELRPANQKAPKKWALCENFSDITQSTLSTTKNNPKTHTHTHPYAYTLKVLDQCWAAIVSTFWHMALSHYILSEKHIIQAWILKAIKHRPP